MISCASASLRMYSVRGRPGPRARHSRTGRRRRTRGQRPTCSPASRCTCRDPRRNRGRRTEASSSRRGHIDLVPLLEKPLVRVHHLERLGCVAGQNQDLRHLSSPPSDGSLLPPNDIAGRGRTRPDVRHRRVPRLEHASDPEWRSDIVPPRPYVGTGGKRKRRADEAMGSGCCRDAGAGERGAGERGISRPRRHGAQHHPVGPVRRRAAPPGPQPRRRCTTGSPRCSTRSRTPT